MDSSDEQYIIFENRLASFRGSQPVVKGRVSKAFHWPHKSLSPVALAKAGFFFEPHPKSPDNVVCFLCAKSLDGWEEHDNPIEEHLKHSPTCGWAITAAIEAGVGNYRKVHPLDPAMIEARKATFAGRWPYESKKGFKCKTKKLVEAGWKYTPSLDADDMATCAYCQLALEGWESDDNPYDEHYRREPNCPFFTLISQYPAPKKSGRAKAPRSSKASRLSVQSIATVATGISDLASAADITADHDDSVMTTASNMTQGGKRMARKKKAGPSKGRKTKAKKEDVVEILEDEPPQQQVPPQKAPRGRKRTSDEMEDPIAADTEEPAPKKRTARARASNAVENANSAVLLPDTEMVDAAPTKQATTRKKARASHAKKARKTSQSSLRSQVSPAASRVDLPDDDEIECQLEADLERYQSDIEEPAVGEAAADSGSEKPRTPARAKGRGKTANARKTSGQMKPRSEAYAMFDPTPVEPNQAEIEAEFKALEAEMDLEEPESETLVVPKKGRKAGTRKASKQTKKAKEPEPQSDPADPATEHIANPPESQSHVLEEARPAETEPEPELADPDASTGTVVNKATNRPSMEKRGRGRPSKKSTASQASIQESEERRRSPLEPEVQFGSSRNRESLSSLKGKSGKIARKPVPAAAKPSTPAEVNHYGPAVQPPVKTEKALPLPPSSATRLSQPPATPPRARTTPSASAKQAAISPSQSPQSSDAENRPPSSAAASGAAIDKRVALAPKTATPMHSSSPERRNNNNNNNNNFVAGLQSTTPWQPADLDLLFSPTSPHDADNKENDGVSRLLRRGAALTSPEKRMSVEEWIYHNAGLAEQKLKNECEAMVSAFEREGARAIRVLEGLVVD